MKKQVDFWRTDLEFQIGDWISHDSNLYDNKQLPLKWIRNFHNVILVLSRLTKKNPIAYELELPPTSKVRPVFHVSLLKPYHGSIPPPSLQNQSSQPETNTILQPTAILDRRNVSSDIIKQVLVQWNDLATEEAT